MFSTAPSSSSGGDASQSWESSGTPGVAESTTVPRSMSCLEPFNAAFAQDTSRSGRIFVTDASLEQVRHCRDPGVGMQADCRKRGLIIHIEEIQEDERFQ